MTSITAPLGATGLGIEMPLAMLLPGPEALGWAMIAIAAVVYLRSGTVPVQEALNPPGQETEVDPTRWEFIPNFGRGNKRAPALDAAVQDLSMNLPSIPEVLAQLTTHGQA